MSNSNENKRPQPVHKDDRPPSKGARLGNWLKQTTAFDMREQWWRLLDLIEKKRRLRRTLYGIGAALVIIVVGAEWIYPRWNQRNVIKIARGWLDAGRLDQAAKSVKEALDIAPENPESWRLASAVAQRLGNKAEAEDYSRHAAQLRPDNLQLALEWASSALLADKLDAADQALSSQPPATLAGSAPALRIAGELARRRGQFTAARDHFETALRLDGPGAAIDEVPLGIILLRAAAPVERQQGLDLLTKSVRSLEWGATSLRALLTDAILHDDRPAMLRWADALRAHPRCTLGDIPNCLLALSKTDEGRFADILVVMEKNHSVDSGNIALLLSWLNQIGRAREAIQWVKTLPPELTRKPPAVVGASESLRQLSDWPALLAWTQNADWGSDLESLRLGYELQAARKLGPSRLAQELSATLQARAAADGERTLFTADTLYSWGMRDDAVALLWAISDQPKIAFQALGTLARHYQVERDATGQYRVFKQLRSLRANDASIANNYAFFAALTGNDLRGAEQAARDNFKTNPDNLAYRSTYALVLCTQNRADEALALLQPVSADWKGKPIMLLPYGLALAGTHHKAEAQNVLASLDQNSLTDAETALIKKALD